MPAAPSHAPLFRIPARETVAGYGPALRMVASVSAEVSAILSAPGTAYDPRSGFSGPAWDAASGRPREYLENWHAWQLPRAAKFCADYERRGLPKYETLSKGILWGAGLGLGGGIAADLFGSSPTGGAAGSAVEGVVRLAAGNGDTLGGKIALFLKKLAGTREAAAESAATEPGSCDTAAFLDAMRAYRVSRGYAAQGEGDGDHVESYANWGVVGMAAGPVLQALVERSGEDKLGPAGAFYASAYSSGDNTMAAAGALYGLYSRRVRESYGVREGVRLERLGGTGRPLRDALQEISYALRDGASAAGDFCADPFQVVNLAIVLALLSANLAVRASGALPVDRQFLVAVEGVVLNIDSLVAALAARAYAAHMRAALLRDVSRPAELARLWARVHA